MDEKTASKAFEETTNVNNKGNKIEPQVGKKLDRNNPEFMRIEKSIQTPWWEKEQNTRRKFTVISNKSVENVDRIQVPEEDYSSLHELQFDNISPLNAATDKKLATSKQLKNYLQRKFTNRNSNICRIAVRTKRGKK